jgi:predicted RNase H-like HicB family nuclease
MEKITRLRNKARQRHNNLEIHTFIRQIKARKVDPDTFIQNPPMIGADLKFTRDEKYDERADRFRNKAPRGVAPRSGLSTENQYLGKGSDESGAEEILHRPSPGLSEGQITVHPDSGIEPPIEMQIEKSATQHRDAVTGILPADIDTDLSRQAGVRKLRGKLHWEGDDRQPPIQPEFSKNERKQDGVEKNKEHYWVRVWWSQEDDRWLADAPDLPGASSDGSSRIDALLNLAIVISQWLKNSM